MGASKSTNIANLLDHLLRGLAHDIRTPLSVISNDLQYFATQLPKGECDRSLRRCKEISEHLSALSAILVDPDMERTGFPLLALLHESLSECWALSSISPDVTVESEQQRLGYVLKEIDRVLGLEASSKANAVVHWQDDGALVFSFPAHALSDTFVSATSLTELVESITNSHFTSPPIADAVCSTLKLAFECKREGEQGVIVLRFS